LSEVRAFGLLLAAIIGALACGGLFFAIGVVVALYAVGLFAAVKAGDQAFTWLVAAVTAIGVVGGAWIGARVFRWLAVPRDEPPTAEATIAADGAPLEREN
jgi:hypothetical protein